MVSVVMRGEGGSGLVRAWRHSVPTPRRSSRLVLLLGAFFRLTRMGFEARSKVIGGGQDDSGCALEGATGVRSLRSDPFSHHPAVFACRTVNSSDCCAARPL